MSNYYDTSYPPSLWDGGTPPVIPATGATAGIPGTFTPAGSQAPASVAAMTGITASPATAWTVGQYVQTGSGQTYWNGTGWVAGAAPVLDQPATQASSPVQAPTGPQDSPRAPGGTGTAPRAPEAPEGR
jgi:hypothetical protein